MANLTSRCKAAFLAATMVTSGCVSAVTFINPFPRFTAFVNDHRQETALLVSAAIIAKIRLTTKGTKFDYKASDWSDDLKTLLNSYNIFDIKTYKNIARLVDKWVVGRKLKKIESIVRTKKDDGTVEATKDNKTVSTPFGLMGLFDTYVLSQMKEFNDYVPMIATFLVLLADPAYSVQNSQDNGVLKTTQSGSGSQDGIKASAPANN